MILKDRKIKNEKNFLGSKKKGTKFATTRKTPERVLHTAGEEMASSISGGWVSLQETRDLAKIRQEK